MKTNILKEIFEIKDSEHFERLCLQVFQYQSENVEIYKKYINLLGISAHNVKSISEIPFLPIEFFKTHEVKSAEKESEIIFLSSGTGLSGTSKHFVCDLSLYIESFNFSFKYFYGDINNYVFLALLPSYLEREGSSLIFMAENLLKNAKQTHSGFYLYEFEKLREKLMFLESKNIPVILLGVSFALSDFFEQYNLELKNTVIIETGGMKGRKKEIVKEELHRIIKQGSGLSKIHSEYGMTELLSQAYSKGENIFYCPPQMKVLIRDTNDPFSYLPDSSAGGINIIDLANYYSCSFIETKDLGRTHKDGSFEVIGRFDTSDVRGCNLLIV